LTDKNGVHILPIVKDMKQRENAVLIVNLACDDHAQINGYIAEKYPEATGSGIVSLAEAGKCREVIFYCGETKTDALIAAVQAGTDVSITVLTGPASPVLRDETALFSAIDNGVIRVNRAEQDHARSFISYGYKGRPTLVVDGETAYQAGRLLNDPNAKTTKLVSVTCLDSEPTIKEVVTGTAVAELLDDRGFKGTALIGGACGRFIKSEAFHEIHIGFNYECDSIRLYADSECIVDALAKLYKTAKEQSCAKCVMCREGSWQLSAIFTDITGGRSNRDDIALIEDICPIISAGTLCMFGRNMVLPALSAVAECRNDLEKHVVGRNCPAGKCAGLMRYIIDPALCDGCGECLDICPEEAIEGKDGFIHVIDEKQCEKCGKCADSCPVKAIKTDSGAIRTPKKPVRVGRFMEKGEIKQ